MRGAEAVADFIARETANPSSPEAQAISDALRARHGQCVAATLFYGSCLRPATPDALGPGGTDERLYDFYLIVDDLRAANPNALLALGNRLLPPNVFYLEIPFGGGRLRCKYAVVTLAQFARGCSPAYFHNYFWGRFAQPAAVAFARDADTRRTVQRALASAVLTLVGNTRPLLIDDASPSVLWTRAFLESYRCELRPESSDRAAQIYRADASRYGALAALLPAPRRGSTGARRQAALAWVLRRIVGKTFNVLRLMKAAFTFAGGVDYILWKIERHSGVRPQLTSWQRRHPLLAGPWLALRYYRRGAFR